MKHELKVDAVGGHAAPNILARIDALIRQREALSQKVADWKIECGEAEKLAAKWQIAYRDMTQQRDALLAACEALRDYYDAPAGRRTTRSLIDDLLPQLRAAIAKAKP